MRPLLGETALYRYILALERGDITVIESALQAAARDERVARLIADVHEAYRSTEDAIAYERGHALVRSLLQHYGAGRG